MTELSLLELCAVVYLTLAFIKTMLCYAVIDAAEGVFRRRYGNSLHIVRLAVIVVCTPAVVLFMVPRLLVDEGLSFFVIYSKFKVMRDVSSAI